MNTPTIDASVAGRIVQPGAERINDVLSPRPHLPAPVSANAPLAGGLHGAIGCDFIASTNQLAFVEFDGKVSVLNLIQPQVAVVSQGTTVLKGTWLFDCETGALGGALNGPGDIWWEQETTTLRRMVPISGAQIVNLGHVNFDAVTSASLQSLSYSTTPIAGNNDPSNQLTTGDVFAVRTNAGNFCKIQVLAYGYDMHIRWATYKVGPRYRVLGTGYNQPEDIVVMPDGVHAYVTERTGNVLKVDLNNANRAAAQVLVSGLTAPHQMQLDAMRNHVYVVEFAPNGRLLKIDLSNGHQVTMASGLDHPVGLALALDEQSAYVTEQAASGGRLRRVDLGTGAATNVAGGLTAPFMMAWIDPARERLALCERDPANRIAIVDLANGNAITRISSGIAARPSDLAIVAAHKALVTCDSEIDELALGADPLTGPLFKGIGFVPFDRIDPVTGLANTSVDPAYFFQVQNVPFGATLPVKINHYLASIDGAKWYQILIDGVPRGDSFSDYLWNPATNRYDAVVIVPNDVGPVHNAYPVRSLADLVLYFNSDLGGMVPTTGYPDGLHTIEVRFYNAVGGALPVGPPNGGPHTIAFDNSPCFASLISITSNGQSAGAECGILDYTALTDNVVMTYSATQAHNSATYSFRVLRGANEIVSLDQGGPVGAPVYTETATVATLLGACAAPAGPGMAGFLEELYVATRAINGEGRLSQYDASAARAFMLAK
jgi:DNA-binding beta-propeller fold protein YncE